MSAEPLRVDVGIFVVERGPHDVDDLVGHAPALVERHAEERELAIEVPGPDAEDHPATRELVERHERLRGHERVAVRRDEHV